MGIVRKTSTIGLPPAPGAERHLALNFADSANLLPGGHLSDLLGVGA
ncbi:hypothetical protein [Nocardia testacea]